MKRLLVVATLFAAAAAPLAAGAQEMGGAPPPGRQAPLSRVLAVVSAHSPGRHLNTTMGESDGRPAYFVQWQLPNGRVVIFVVDAETAQIVGRQGG
jgi:uncharacterized membrane protein YkoI